MKIKKEKTALIFLFIISMAAGLFSQRSDFPKLNGQYMEAEKIGSLRGMYPFISPDESYITFAARRPGKNDSDLYISFCGPDDTWSEGISLGNEINSASNEGNSFVTADGKYLFFSRKLDIYWVSAKIIEDIKSGK